MNLIAQKDLNLRTSLAKLLTDLDPDRQVVQCEDWDCTLLELIQTGNVRFLFLDLNVLGISWQQRCKDLLATLNNTKMILTAEDIDKSAVVRLFEQGLWSYIPNATLTRLGNPIVNLILKGGQYFPSYLLDQGECETNSNGEKNYTLPSGEKLTRRQREVLSYLKQGLSNKQIAGKMNISEPTVKLHIHGLFHKLGATNRTQIVLKAGELGFI